MKLFHVEHLLDSGRFTDIFVNLSRDTIDLVVPYEYQNVRAYFYYLTLKARILERRDTHQFKDLINLKNYNFNFDKIFAEIQENTRFAGRLITFFGYCHASNGINLTEYIFMRRINLFEELFEENLCLLIFLVTHFEEQKGEIRGPVLNQAFLAFGNLYTTYAEEIKVCKPNFDFEDRVKKLSVDFLNPIFSFSQKLINDRKKGKKNPISEFLAVQFFIEKFKKIKPERTVFLDSVIQDWQLQITNQELELKTAKLLTSNSQITEFNFGKIFAKKWKEDEHLQKKNMSKLKAIFEDGEGVKKEAKPSKVKNTCELQDDVMTEEFDFETFLKNENSDL